MMKKVLKWLLEALCGFILWTAILTPYMLFIVKTNTDQYFKWLLMELIIIPPVSIIVINITNYIVKKLIKK